MKKMLVILTTLLLVFSNIATAEVVTLAIDFDFNENANMAVLTYFEEGTEDVYGICRMKNSRGIAFDEFGYLTPNEWITNHWEWYVDEYQDFQTYYDYVYNFPTSETVDPFDLDNALGHLAIFGQGEYRVTTYSKYYTVDPDMMDYYIDNGAFHYFYLNNTFLVMTVMKIYDADTGVQLECYNIINDVNWVK